MGLNAVDIDPDALATEAQAIADGAAGPASSSTPPSSPDPLAPSAPLVPGELTIDQVNAIAQQNAAGLIFLLDRVAAIFAPNWEISSDETRELGNAGAVAMAAWFPSGVLPLKYMVLLNFAGTAANIANARRDPETGEWRPLKKPLPPASSSSSTPPASSSSARDGTADQARR